MKNEKYIGKKFSIMGDSVSTLHGYNPDGFAVQYEGPICSASGVCTYGSTWWGMVIDALGGELLVNNSFSGSLVCRLPGCDIPSYGCSDERCSGLGKDGVAPDVVMVYIGTNDFGYGVKPEPENESDKSDLSVFATAYSAMLRKIKNNYPKAEIWCFTLSATSYNKCPDYKFTAIRHGTHISEFCRIIAECAEDNGCKLIDLYNQPRKYDTFDSMHPNADGMKTLAEVVLGGIGGPNR